MAALPLLLDMGAASRGIGLLCRVRPGAVLLRPKPRHQLLFAFNPKGVTAEDRNLRELFSDLPFLHRSVPKPGNP
jgi:hypothetical protein